MEHSADKPSSPESLARVQSFRFAEADEARFVRVTTVAASDSAEF